MFSQNIKIANHGLDFRIGQHLHHCLVRKVGILLHHDALRFLFFMLNRAMLRVDTVEQSCKKDIEVEK